MKVGSRENKPEREAGAAARAESSGSGEPPECRQVAPVRRDRILTLRRLQHPRNRAETGILHQVAEYPLSELTLADVGVPVTVGVPVGGVGVGGGVVVGGGVGVVTGSISTM